MKLKIYTDGGARGNPGIAGAGIHVEDLSGNVIYEASFALGETTNNVAEYQGLLKALEWLVSFEDNNQVEHVDIFMDSNLVVEQINRNWKIKQQHLAEIAMQVWAELGKLKTSHTLSHVRREKNKFADALANQAMDSIS